MCTPRLPEVLGQPVQPTSASTSRTTAATRFASSKSVPGWGSRSMRSSSGCSTASRRVCQGWNSTVDICTAQTTDANSVTQSSSAVRPDGNDTSHRLDPVGSTLGQPLLVDLLARPDTLRKAMQHAGAFVQSADDALADRDVVVREVELRLPRAGKSTRSGLVIFTVRSPTAISVKGDATRHRTSPELSDAVVAIADHSV